MVVEFFSIDAYFVVVLQIDLFELFLQEKLSDLFFLNLDPLLPVLRPHPKNQVPILKMSFLFLSVDLTNLIDLLVLYPHHPLNPVDAYLLERLYFGDIPLYQHADAILRDLLLGT